MTAETEVVKREFSLAETDVEFDRSKADTNAVNINGTAVGIPASSSSFFGIEVDDNDPEFVATLRLVAYSSIGGAIILFISALDNLMIFNFVGALLNGALAIVVPLFGYRGAKQQRQGSLVAYVYLCMVLALFQLLLAVWRIGVLARAARGNVELPPMVSRKSLITLRVLETLLSVLSAMFWGVAGYTGSQLGKTITAKKFREAQRQQHELVRRRASTPPGTTVLGVDAFRVSSVDETC